MSNRARFLSRSLKIVLSVIMILGIVAILSYASPISTGYARQNTSDYAPVVPTPTRVMPGTQELNSSPQAVAFANPLQSTATICGQAVDVTTADRGTFNYVFYACDAQPPYSNTPYLWLPFEGFTPGAYYRVKDGMIDQVNPRTTIRGDVTQRLTSQFPDEPIPSCSVCGASPPKIPAITTGPDLIVADFRFNPPPEAYKNFSLIVDIQNSLDVQPYVPRNGYYEIEVIFTLQIGDSVSFFFDSENSQSAHRLSVAKLPPLEAGGETEITISDLTFPTGVTNGSIEVRLIPKDSDSNPRNNTRIKDLTITGLHTYGIFQCIGALSAVAYGNWIKTDPTALNTELFLNTSKKLNLCYANDDQACAADQLSRMSQTAPDLLASMIELTAGSIKSTIGCSLETLNFITSIVASDQKNSDAVVIYPKGLNVRAGPGTSYASTGSLRRDDELEVIGRNQDCNWLQVVTPTGTQGWVSGLAKYVTRNVSCGSIPEVSVSSTTLPVTSNAPFSKYPEGAVRFNDHYYKIFEERLTWDEARKRCEEPDGHLASITSKAENEFLFEMVNSKPFPQWTTAWLGASDKAQDANWMWITGEPFNPLGYLIIDGGATENYLNFRLSSGKWEDYPVSGEKVGEQWFICEWEVVTLPVEQIPVANNPAPVPAPEQPPAPAPSDAPPVSFSAERTTLNAGECTNLRWDVDNVKAVYLDNQGMAGHATQKVCPAATQTFRLVIVQQDNSKVEQTVTIEVNTSGSSASADISISFSADRTTLNPGECAVLRWDVDNVNEIHLDKEGVVGHDTRKVCPDATKTYKLIILRRDGNEEKRTVTIEVNGSQSNEHSHNGNYIDGQLRKTNNGYEQFLLPCSGDPHLLKLSYSPPTSPPPDGLVEDAYYRVKDPQLFESTGACDSILGCPDLYLLVNVDDNPYDNWEQINSCD